MSEVAMAIVKANGDSVQVNLSGFVLDRLGLTLAEDVSFETWHSMGLFLSHVERSRQWWVGDWLAYGERRYGESYAQAMDATSLAYQTLANWAWVASRIERERRRWELGWSHHAAVASLEPDEQDGLLDLAVKWGWSEKELRQRVKSDVASIGESGQTAEVIPVAAVPELAGLAAEAVARLEGYRTRGGWAELSAEETIALLDWITEVRSHFGV